MWPSIENLIIGAIYLIGYGIAVFLGNFIVCYILSKIKDDTCKNQGLKDAGKYIGMFERTLTLTFMYMNVPTAIAIIFAAKSIVRFDASKDRNFAEYYLLGSFTSITFAVIIGFVFNYITSIVFQTNPIIFI